MMTDQGTNNSSYGYEQNSTTTPFDWSRLNLNVQSGPSSPLVNNYYNGYPMPGNTGNIPATFPFYTNSSGFNINPFTCTTNTFNTPMAPSFGNSSSSQHRMVGMNELRSMSTRQQCKRKTQSPPPFPVKQHITEEKMALHMSQLHISSETPVMNINCVGGNHSTSEPEESKERRLYMCEEMRKLQSDSILPKSIIDKLTNSKPCTALVVWRPPQKLFTSPPLSSSITRTTRTNPQNPNRGEQQQQEENNNTNESENNNASGSIDLMINTPSSMEAVDDDINIQLGEQGEQQVEELIDEDFDMR